MFILGGGNGQWARTSNTQNAETFLAEQRQKAEEQRERQQRSAAARRNAWTRLRSLVRRRQD